jgi:hypothetical protein
MILLEAMPVTMSNKTFAKLKSTHKFQRKPGLGSAGQTEIINIYPLPSKKILISPFVHFVLSLPINKRVLLGIIGIGSAAPTLKNGILKPHGC